MKKACFRSLALVGALSLSSVSFADDFSPMGPGVPGGKVCQPHVTVEKSGPREVKVGDFLTYEIEVTNTGTCDLENLRLVDILPERVQFRGASPEPDREPGPGVGSGERVVWRGFDLRAGESETFEIEIHVVGPPNRTLVNRACVTHPLLGGLRVCDTVRTEVETGAET